MDFLLRRPESYKLKKNYKFGRVLGTGTFGEVKQAMWTAHQPPIEVAVKIILKQKVKGQQHIVYDEMDVLKDLDHPNIVRFHEWFESKTKFYLVFQLADGGELFERICERGKFTEADSVKAIKAVLHGVQYLHSREVVHRDLKPENLLYEHPNSENLLIADFGIARHLATPDEVLTTLAGSPGYAAPEVLTRAGHGRPVDMWAIGVITYTLLCGYSPFRSTSRQELIAETTRAKVEFHDKYWAKISEDAKDFICSLIRAEPGSRLTAEQALDHRWLHEGERHEHDISLGLRENWSARRRWKMAISGVQAAVRLQMGGASAASSRAASIRNAPVGSPPPGTAAAAAAAFHDSSARQSGEYHTAAEDSDAEVAENSRSRAPSGQELQSREASRHNTNASSTSTSTSTSEASDSRAGTTSSPPIVHTRTMDDETARRVSSEIQSDLDRKLTALDQRAQELAVSSSGGNNNNNDNN